MPTVNIVRLNHVINAIGLKVIMPESPRPYCCLWHHPPISSYALTFHLDVVSVALSSTYLSSRSFRVRCNNTFSCFYTSCTVFPMAFFSVLRFSSCTLPLSALSSPPLSLNHRLCADDTQLLFSFYPPNFDPSITNLQTALQQISSWIAASLLTLNSSKTEFLLTGLRKQLDKIHNSSLNTTHSARNLGFILDEQLTFSDQRRLGITANRSVECRMYVSHAGFVATTGCLSLYFWFGNVSTECSSTSQGREYVGHKSLTKNGLQCLPWSSVADRYGLSDDDFADGSVQAASNYCRSPRSWTYAHGVLCIVDDPAITFAHCDVPICGQSLRYIKWTFVEKMQVLCKLKFEVSSKFWPISNPVGCQHADGFRFSPQ